MGAAFPRVSLRLPEAELNFPFGADTLWFLLFLVWRSQRCLYRPQEILQYGVAFETEFLPYAVAALVDGAMTDGQ